MRDIAWYDQQGKIVLAGKCVEGDENTLQIPFTGFVELDDHVSSVRGCRVDIATQQIVPIEEAPSIYHTWDWTTYTWCLLPGAVQLCRDSSCKQIELAATRARSRYITTTPGQDAVYTAKYQEALTYIAAGYPEDLSSYPFVAGESIPNSWMTATQASTRIATIGSYWRDVVGPSIESARVNGKDTIFQMNDIESIEIHTAGVVAFLNGV